MHKQIDLHHLARVNSTPRVKKVRLCGQTEATGIYPVRRKTMSTFKILVTSQKGGVGKSTVSANLAAYFKRQGESVTLIDFDTHGSSSTWLTRAPSIGVVVQHHVLPLDQGGNHPSWMRACICAARPAARTW